MHRRCTVPSLSPSLLLLSTSACNYSTFVADVVCWCVLVVCVCQAAPAVGGPGRVYDLVVIDEAAQSLEVCVACDCTTDDDDQNCGGCL